MIAGATVVEREVPVTVVCTEVCVEALLIIIQGLSEAEYTPPVIYSKDTRYKLVYLVRAMMPENVAVNFHPGQPIEVYLNL